MLELDFLFITFEKIFWLKNVSCIYNEFFVSKIFLISEFKKIKNVALQYFSRILKMSRKRVNVEKKEAIYFPKSSSSPNKYIFVRAKTVCLLWENCWLWVCLLWVSTVARTYENWLFNFSHLQKDWSGLLQGVFPFEQLDAHCTKIFLFCFRYFLYEWCFLMFLQPPRGLWGIVNGWSRSSWKAGLLPPPCGAGAGARSAVTHFINEF